MDDITSTPSSGLAAPVTASTMPPVTRRQAAISPFLDPGQRTKPDSLALMQLGREVFEPVYLRAYTGAHDGYAEGAVVNTKFGSFPHSTMLDIPWGSQVRASVVDTGSRGRSLKRKRGGQDDGGGKECESDDVGGGTTPQTPGTPAAQRTNDNEVAKKGGAAGAAGPAVEAASSGFIHILPPTPEIWTMSLPHRTQVVYTPDYSYILHRIRARPGSRLIEAGAGSGSFTHAAVRAVYNGYPKEVADRKGKVFSFEYHPQRFEKMGKELSEHGLDGVVQLTHRDVYEHGFSVDGKSPEVDAIFLDLPAPWRAIPHLTRQRVKTGDKEPSGPSGGETSAGGDTQWVSPLNPKKTVHMCTFSPCIEQVTKTVAVMRRLGWANIETVEIMNKRIIVARDRIGLGFGSEPGVIQAPANVEEAVTRLAEIEARAREHAAQSRLSKGPADADKMDIEEDDDSPKKAHGTLANGTKPQDADGEIPSLTRALAGQVVTRLEPEIKTHTSYLTFAFLPREWTEEDEQAALARWPVGDTNTVIGAKDRATRKQEKREKHLPRKERAKMAAAAAAAAAAVAVTGEGAESGVDVRSS